MAKTRAIAACLLALASLTACSTGSDPAAGQEPREKLTVGLMGLVADASVQHAIDEGLFEQQGLEVTTTVISNPAAMIAAVQSGEVDVAFVPTVPYINAVAQGIPLTAVAGGDELPQQDPEAYIDGGVYVAPESGIEDAGDLAGRTVAIPARKGVIEMGIADALNKARADTSSVEWVTLDQAAALDSLKSGKVDAAAVFSPFSGQADKAGLKNVLKPGASMFAGKPVDIFAAGEEAASSKSRALKSFRTALHEANAWAEENNAEAVSLGAKMAGLDLESSEIPPVDWATDLTAEGLDSVADSMVGLGFLPKKPDFSQLVLK